MAYSRLGWLLPCFLLCAGLFAAQPKDEFRKSRVGVVPEKAPDAVDMGVDNNRQARHFVIKPKWDEASYKFAVYVENEHPSDLEVLGVQASPGLYIANVPNKIPASGRAKITLIWAGSPGVANGAEYLKVLTPVGEKTVQIDLQQEKRVDFDTHELSWRVGGLGETKVVTIKCGTPVKIVAVQAAGAGNTATVKEVTPGIYQVEVTPGSVKRQGFFPVTIEFSPVLSGVPSVIQCVIVE